MALDVEEIVDRGVYGKKSLGGGGRFEALHLALSSSHRLVRICRPIILSPSDLMLVSRRGIS